MLKWRNVVECTARELYHLRSMFQLDYRLFMMFMFVFGKQRGCYLPFRAGIPQIEK